MDSLKPFQQVPFADLPAAPRRPHEYGQSDAVELEMDSAPFGRLRIHYRTLGRGEPLLLIHGLMTSSYSWRYVMGRLANEYQIIAPDLPGAGRSDQPADRSYHPERLAEWIGEFQRAVGIRGCLTIGNSLGGYLCMRLALRDPGAISRLTNIHSPGLPTARMWALRCGFAVPGLVNAVERRILADPDRWAHHYVHYFDETLKSLEEARVYGSALATPAGAACFLRYLRETCDVSACRQFAQTLERRLNDRKPFPIPLQLIYSRQDPMVPPSIGQRLKQLIPDARLAWMNDTSHFAHVDTPDRLLDLVLPFLKPAGTGPLTIPTTL